MIRDFITRFGDATLAVFAGGIEFLADLFSNTPDLFT